MFKIKQTEGVNYKSYNEIEKLKAKFDCEHERLKEIAFEIKCRLVIESLINL